jgi:hypothetical protein
LSVKKKISPRVAKLIDNTLESIIDQWYLSVSDYYVTIERKSENPDVSQTEELKRFHDETGHRIKFNKGDLDFTYGLSLQSGEEGHLLEVSVNNKVPNFNYNELVRRLSSYYEGARSKPIAGFKDTQKLHNRDIFSLQDQIRNSISVEQREGKADIVRLSFGIVDEHFEELIADPPSFMEMVHNYCVAPLRRIYADLYRTKSKRK